MNSWRRWCEKCQETLDAFQSISRVNVVDWSREDGIVIKIEQVRSPDDAQASDKAHCVFCEALTRSPGGDYKGAAAAQKTDRPRATFSLYLPRNLDDKVGKTPARLYVRWIHPEGLFTATIQRTGRPLDSRQSPPPRRNRGPKQ